MWQKFVIATEPNTFEVRELDGAVVLSTTDFAEFEAFCAANADKFDE